MPRQKTPAIASSRDRLREAAKILFAERGFEATTTAATCRLVGTSQSQLIKHFTSSDGGDPRNAPRPYAGTHLAASCVLHGGRHSHHGFHSTFPLREKLIRFACSKTWLLG